MTLKTEDYQTKTNRAYTANRLRWISNELYEIRRTSREFLGQRERTTLANLWQKTKELAEKIEGQ